MLARSLLCRLAADVPQISTHDLARISRVVHRTVLARNATSITSTAGLSHAYKLAYAVARRSYATATATTTTKKPAKTVKKVTVKKTVTKKPAAKNAAAGKKPAAKKVAPKKTLKAKKAVPKKKPAKRVLTEKGLAKKEKQESIAKAKGLRETALTSPKLLPETAWTAFTAEKAQAKTPLAEIAALYKALTPAEREHYNHIASQNKATNEAAYKAWVLSHTTEQIHFANLARLNLRRRHKAAKEEGKTGARRNPKDTESIKDERQPKRPVTSFSLFVRERNATGDMKGISTPETMKLISVEWKALSASEKKKYEDLAAADKQRYISDYQSAFGRKP